MKKLFYIWLIALLISCHQNNIEAVDPSQLIEPKISVKEDSIAAKLKEIENLIESNEKMIDDLED